MRKKHLEFVVEVGKERFLRQEGQLRPLELGRFCWEGGGG